MSIICVSSQEEKFIFVVDKYITHHRDSVNNNIFYRKTLCAFRWIPSEVFLFTGAISQFVLSR